MPSPPRSWGGPGDKGSSFYSQVQGAKWDSSSAGGCLTRDSHLACWLGPGVHAGATHSVGSFGGLGLPETLMEQDPSGSPVLPHQSATSFPDP